METGNQAIPATRSGIEDLFQRKARFFGREVSLLVIGSGLLAFGVFLLFMGLVQFSTPNMPDNDGFYHIKMAYLMRTEGLKPDFPWLPLTILNPREFYNHHFLFHVLLIPFTFGDLVMGAKWAAVLFASLAFLLIWRLLQAQRVPFAFLWSLGLLAVSEAFIYRMSITRAQSLSLGLLALALHWLLAGRHKRLIPLGFIYVWFYNAFPLLLGVSSAYVLAQWLLEKRLDLRPLFFSGVGIAAGLIINPYFPYNLLFIVQHILPKLVDTTAISVGSEWYPYTTAQLLANSPLALLAFASAALALGLAGRRMDRRTAAALLLSCLFGLMLFQSRRFVEYFPAFALILAAFAWAPLILRQRSDLLQAREQGRVVRFYRLRQHAAVLVLILLLAAGSWTTFNRAQSALQTSKPYRLYAGASAWLQENTAAGERVFQTDWDDFPRLFFYNHHNTYLVGLDPTYMQFYDAALYDVWVDITRGRVVNPSALIADNFGARYVHTDLLHEGFIQQAENDPRLVEVYRDAEALIYQVLGE